MYLFIQQTEIIDPNDQKKQPDPRFISVPKGQHLSEYIIPLNIVQITVLQVLQWDDMTDKQY